MKIGKIYTITRIVEQFGRPITVCRMVKLLEVGEEVMVDNGDGTQSRIPMEEFEKIVKEK